jgi:2,3-bisphosphoglycerate-dependent phosphoglycerate mutase
MKTYKLILSRHGESIWNKANRFTGWTNISLSNYGIKKTINSSIILKNNDLIPNKILSSKLIRSINSAEIIQNSLKIKKNINSYHELNERHYGMLEGMNREEASKKFGYKTIQNIRQDFYLLPYIINNKPLIIDNHTKYNQNHSQNQNIDKIKKFGESNYMVTQRLLLFWENQIKNQLLKNEILLIISHKNTIRCLMKIIENLNTQEFKTTDINNNQMILYNLDNNFNFINKFNLY